MWIFVHVVAMMNPWMVQEFLSSNGFKKEGPVWGLLYRAFWVWTFGKTFCHRDFEYSESFQASEKSPVPWGSKYYISIHFCHNMYLYTWKIRRTNILQLVSVCVCVCFFFWPRHNSQSSSSLVIDGLFFATISWCSLKWFSSNLTGTNCPQEPLHYSNLDMCFTWSLNTPQKLLQATAPIKKSKGNEYKGTFVPFKIFLKCWWIDFWFCLFRCCDLEQIPHNSSRGALLILMIVAFCHETSAILVSQVF